MCYGCKDILYKKMIHLMMLMMVIACNRDTCIIVLGRNRFHQISSFCWNVKQEVKTYRGWRKRKIRSLLVSLSYPDGMEDLLLVLLG